MEWLARLAGERKVVGSNPVRRICVAAVFSTRLRAQVLKQIGYGDDKSSENRSQSGALALCNTGVRAEGTAPRKSAWMIVLP